MRKYATEVIGTFLFVTTFIGVVLSNASPIGIGAALMVVVYAGGHISGGHFNPAVSLAVCLRGRLSVGELLPYVAAQLVGAFAAYLIALGIWTDELDSVQPLDLSEHGFSAFLAELVFTFALCWVFLNVATSRDSEGNGYYGLAIGFTMAAGVFAVGSVSGGAFNPAVAFGLSLAGIFSWKWIVMYLIAQTFGSLLAVGTFTGLNQDDR